MHISEIELKSGRSLGTPEQCFSATAMTIFVGPNNAGKSVLLREIELACKDGRTSPTMLLLRSLTFKGLDDQAQIKMEIEKFRSLPTPGEHIPPGSMFFRGRNHRFHAYEEQLNSALADPSIDSNLFAIWLYNYTLILNGPNRTNLIENQPTQDLQQVPTSSFNKLFQDDGRRAQARQIIYNAFNRYLVIDPTAISQLRLRLSDRAPTDEREERGIDAASVTFHGAADLVTAASDGVKAFTGMIVEAIAGDPKVMLIDEPEAFLHPASAFKLGNEISKLATVAGRNVFVSTHSPTFIMGCLHAGVPVNIVRLTYTNKVATSRLLQNADLVKMMRNPLLRSAGVISALFYEFVIITEADTDRAFYQEINERLSRYTNNGIPNCLFINAQNKQTIRTILGPLRELGIPAAAIIDIDGIKDGGTEWTDLLTASGVPDSLQQSLNVLRSDVKRMFDKTGKEMRNGGIGLLLGEEQKTVTHLIETMAEYGVFLVPHGELEGWLKSVGIITNKSRWLIQMFEKMGDDPETPDYVKPGDDDVWAFLKTIKDWLIKPSRKGIPD